MSKKILITVGIFIFLGVASFIFQICPPKGPWPTPPWCESGSKLFNFKLPFGIGGTSTNKLPENITDFDISKPKYPGSRSAFAFPPSCDMIPDAIGKSICNYYKEGAIIFWQEEACDAMPFEAAKNTCKEERIELKKFGDKNAKTLRKENPEWWKRPDLNVFVYGDTRLRTEELRPDISVWGGGSYDGWRDDEIFMTHSAGVMKIVSHSFGYLGGNDLDFMRNRLIKDEGIKITGPNDLKKPEVVKINNDLKYLESRSQIFKELSPAIAKNLDNKEVMVDFTFPDGSKKVSNISANAIIPQYKNYLIQYYKWQVDAGADGMFIDDISGLSPANSFSDAVMKQFGIWLATNTDKTILAKYGVTNPTNFNYREYLKQQGFTAAKIEAVAGKNINASEEWRKIPLMTEFRRFLTQGNQKALGDIVTEVKAYAREKGIDNFIATGNAAGLAPSGAFANQYLDYLTFEHGYLKNNDPLLYTSVIPLTHLAEAKERPVANQIVVTDWDNLAHNTEQTLKMNLLKLMVMESYSAGSGTSYVRYSAIDPRQKSPEMENIYNAMEDRTDLKEVQKAYGFMRHNKSIFKDFNNSTAQVAIIMDNDEIVSEWKNYFTAGHQYSVENISKQLEATGIAYDVINPDQLVTRANERRYKFVILPTIKTDQKNLETAIKKAKTNGIKIVSTGSTPANISALSDINSNESGISSVIKNSVPTLKLPLKMKAVVKTNNKGNYVVHLMNYSYNASGFIEQKNIPIDVNFFGNIKKIKFASLEKTDFIELDITKPVIPSITTYGMLIVEK